MHVDFDPLNVEWSTFTSNPTSDELYHHPQTGGYAIFRGIPYQRGNGLGSVFRRLFRYLLPIGKEIGSAIGRQGLESGNRVLSNVLEGKDLKQSLIDEGKAGLKSLLDKASSGLEKQQTGQGVFDFKKYRKSEKKTLKLGKHIHKLASTLGPPNFLPSNRKVSTRVKKRQNSTKHKPTPKRLRVDSLGAY